MLRGTYLENKLFWEVEGTYLEEKLFWGSGVPTRKTGCSGRLRGAYLKDRLVWEVEGTYLEDRLLLEVEGELLRRQTVVGG